ncbi:MAG: CHAT domain-containing protein, partial [Steroidobacteraceae bacterium]|nr:CHAT domain-containing protein [Steroidobacteraceae bacterium]
DIARSQRHFYIESRALTGLGVTHLKLGQPSLAVTYLEEAAQSIRRAGDKNRLLPVLSALGDAYAALGDRSRAVAAHREAVDNLTPSASVLRRARLNLALADELAHQGQFADAIERYSFAADLSSTLQNSTVVRALIGRALVHRKQNRLTDAERDLARAATLARVSGNQELLIRATHELAALEHQRGDFARALQQSTAAVKLLFDLQSLTTDEISSSRLEVRLRHVIEMHIDLLGEQLQAAYRQQAADHLPRNIAARALLIAHDTFGFARRSDGGDGTMSNSREELIALYDSLSGKLQRFEELTEQRSDTDTDLRALQLEIALLQSRIAGIRARTAADAESSDSVADLARLQARLPSDTALLAYRVGAHVSWLWVVSSRAVEMHRLPARDTIEASIQRLLQAVISLQAKSIIAAEAARLRSLILPARALQTKYRQLLILPDEAVGAVPWRLVDEDPTTTFKEISSLDAILDHRMPRAAKRAEPLRVTLIGDPIFDSLDDRISRPYEHRGPPYLQKLPRLPGTGFELAAIENVAGRAIVARYSGASATREIIMNLQPGTTDVLHIATHALLNQDVPALAALVFSRFDAAGQLRRGELRSIDIRNLKNLPALVVLSACNTAVNPRLSAPGLAHLGRAFLAAGSNTVIASLWPLSDVAAAELMKNFYDALLRKRVSPEAALVHAQSVMSRSARFSEPFFWAGLVTISSKL